MQGGVLYDLIPLTALSLCYLNKYITNKYFPIDDACSCFARVLKCSVFLSSIEVYASFFRFRSHQNPIGILVNDLRPWETIQAIFEWKERFDATSLPSGKTDYHCKIKETLFIQELNPTLNTNLNSDKVSLY